MRCWACSARQGMGNAEAVVDLAGVLLVLVCLIGLAGGGQAEVGAGLLVAVTGGAGQGERGCVAVVGLPGLAGGQQGISCAVEGAGLPGVVAKFAAEGQCLLLVIGGLVVVALVVA